MDLSDMPRHRPLAFDKMECIIKEMQDPETGVPVRSQKLFLTYIPSAFMGYDMVEWLMERFGIEEQNNLEAMNLANQLCQYGYIFPVNDSKNLVLKDDSSYYRFQSPYYWPWQAPRVAGSGSNAPTLGPDNIEYAIYLVKRTLRNKQRHGLEEYELEALATLKKNLAAKWEFITMQAEEQVRLAKERKKGDKIVSDSQERAYWRVARPPPGMPTALEPCPIPVRNRQGKPKRLNEQQLTREIELLKSSLDRTRVKTSIALEALLAYSETFAPYDPWLTTPQPSNPWVSDDTFFWQINSPLVEVPTEKRVQRWAISIEELVADPTGLQEFTNFLRKEYSHENIRFWLAVQDLRKSSAKQIPKKLDNIYEEFLKPGAACEINIDGATADMVAEQMRSGSRYALDHAADHVYRLLLKKDCYPRFVRSDHFQRLLAEGRNVLQKKKFFNFGGQVKKKPGSTGGSGSAAGLTRRRGSDRSLSGSAHELAVCAAQVTRVPEPPPHSHSQSNLADISRDGEEDSSEATPWERSSAAAGGARRRQDSAADSCSSSSDVSAAVERRRLPQQSTLDGGLRGAAPPLRRLSAVEPRHLAPLASSPIPVAPAATPVVSATPTVPHLHPTPTISVSSAPDEATPEEDPPSVFASGDVTPTEPAPSTRHHSTEGTDTPVHDAAASRKTLSREHSTTIEISPASNRVTSDIGSSSPERTRSSEVSEVTCYVDDGAVEVPLVSTATPESINSSDVITVVMATSTASITSQGAVMPMAKEPVKTQHSMSEANIIISECREALTSTIKSESTTESSQSTSAHIPASILSQSQSATNQSLSTPIQLVSETGKAQNAPCQPSSVVSQPTTVTSLLSSDLAPLDQSMSVPCPPSSTTTQGTGAPSHATSSPSVPSIDMTVVPNFPPRPPVAPLAEGEDIGDDHVDKVPSVSLQRVSEESEPTSDVTDAGRNIAHKDDKSSVSESKVVKSDNKVSSERTQRNDICPWEDESSCESDAPFVKTYATLGYL